MPHKALFACLLAVLLAMPAAAQAQSTRSKIFRECQDGALTGDYSAGEIRDARNNIPDDIDQYSACRDVLSRALTAGAGGGPGATAGTSGFGGTTGGSGGAGGAVASTSGAGGTPLITPSTDADREALSKAVVSGGDPAEVDGEEVLPGVTGLAAGSTRHDLPVTLLVLLGLVALAALAGASPALRRHAVVPVSTLRRVLPGRSR